MSVLLTERAGHVVTLTVHRPEKLNALNEEVLRALTEAIAALDADREVRAVVLTGAGDRAFVAGGDLAAMAEMTPVQAKRFADAGHALGAAIEQSRLPVIAAVNGFALGGGCELALACDFIYASDKAKLGQPEVNLGIIPGFGGTQRLPRLVGRARALELCLTGDLIGAEEALRIGLVNAVFPAAELLERTKAIATRIASRAPLAVAAVKRVMGRGLDAPLPTGNELEATAFSALFGTRDQREGMRAFLEKRAAVFDGE